MAQAPPYSIAFASFCAVFLDFWALHRQPYFSKLVGFQWRQNAMTLSHKWMRNVAVALAGFALAWSQPWKLVAQSPAPANGIAYSQIDPAQMKEWLSYLASDALQGRQVFTEGYG